MFSLFTRADQYKVRYESEAIAAYAMRKLNELDLPTGDKISVDVFIPVAAATTSEMSSMRQALSEDLVRNLILLNSIDSSLANAKTTPLTASSGNQSTATDTGLFKMSGNWVQTVSKSVQIALEFVKTTK